MDLYVYDSNYNKIAVIDSYKSLIWAKRYYGIGDCEIYTPATSQSLDVLQIGNFVMRSDDDMICRIEKIEIETDVEEGNYIIATGYDCKKILNQRVIWDQTNYSGTAENFIRQLITANIISPSITDRKISNFQLGTQNGYAERTEEQVTFDPLGDKIISVCKTFGYGCRVIFNQELKTFTFELYKGIDRSYNQSVNPYVVFSPEFDNLSSTTYESDTSGVCNVALVAGEGEGVARKKITCGEASGISRYELFVDAKDISSYTSGEVVIDYNQALINRGIEKLAEHVVVTSYEGQVETGRMYKYKDDWLLGDIVQVKNELGIMMATRIIEVIESYDDDGYSVIPTFEYEEG